MSRLGKIVLMCAVLATAINSTPSSYGQKPQAEPYTLTSDKQTESLFDGSTLKGWKGAEGLWRVEDCAITGQTTAGIVLKDNSFLVWEGGELEDFELKLKFRIEAGNSGIQYRSRDLGNFSVGGYQADIDFTQEYMGIIYDERGRGIMCQRGKRVERGPDGTANVSEADFNNEVFLKKVIPSEWNEYVIRAAGNHLTQTINGIMVADLTDGDTAGFKPSGILALQMHVGPPMKVQYKDIFLTRLNVKDEPSDSLIDLADMPIGAVCCTNFCTDPCSREFQSRLRIPRLYCGPFRR